MNRRTQIFLKLKYQETIGKAPLFWAIQFGASWLFLGLVQLNEKRPHIIVQYIVSNIGALTVAFLFTQLGIPLSEMLINWLKDNWKLAGEIEQKEKENV